MNCTRFIQPDGDGVRRGDLLVRLYETGGTWEWKYIGRLDGKLIFEAVEDPFQLLGLTPDCIAENVSDGCVAWQAQEPAPTYEFMYSTPNVAVNFPRTPEEGLERLFPEADVPELRKQVNRLKREASESPYHSSFLELPGSTYITCFERR